MTDPDVVPPEYVSVNGVPYVPDVDVILRVAWLPRLMVKVPLSEFTVEVFVEIVFVTITQ